MYNVHTLLIGMVSAVYFFTVYFYLELARDNLRDKAQGTRYARYALSYLYRQMRFCAGQISRAIYQSNASIARRARAISQSDTHILASHEESSRISACALVHT